MKRSKQKVSPERRRFERATLKKLQAAGASHDELSRAQWLLTSGRAKDTDDFSELLNKKEQERAGIEYLLRSLGGDEIDTIIYRVRPLPEVCAHG